MRDISVDSDYVIEEDSEDQKKTKTTTMGLKDKLKSNNLNSVNKNNKDLAGFNNPVADKNYKEQSNIADYERNH